MQEIFVSIDDYEGLYEISNLGMVKSLAREVLVCGGRSIKKLPEIIMSAQIRYKNGDIKYGYRSIILHKSGKRKNIHISHLVYNAFSNKTLNIKTHYIEHRDGNNLNDIADNLKAVKPRERITKAYKNIECSSKYVGVEYCKQNRNYRATILVNKKYIKLGSFKYENDAAKEYQRALKEFNETGKVTRCTPMETGRN